MAKYECSFLYSHLTVTIIRYDYTLREDIFSSTVVKDDAAARMESVYVTPIDIQGAIKHGRGNGCVTPDLSVMRDPPPHT